MKNVAIIKHFTFLFILLAACSSRNNSISLSDREREILADSIRQTLHQYYKDIKAEGLLAEFGYLDSSKDFFWVPPGFSTPLSFDSVSSILRKNAPLYSSVDNSWDTLRVIPLSSTTAIYTGKLSSAMTDISGNISEFKLVETGFMIRRKNGWKLLSGQTSIINQ